jgi:hypothetical protein
MDKYSENILTTNYEVNMLLNKFASSNNFTNNVKLNILKNYLGNFVGENDNNFQIRNTVSIGESSSIANLDLTDALANQIYASSYIKDTSSLLHYDNNIESLTDFANQTTNM